MNINKVIANGSTIVDLTDTTATPNDVKKGKIFHTVDGATATGLMSGGLEYEIGTYTPTEEVKRPTISYNRTHSEAPFYVFLCDTIQTAPAGNNSMRWFEYIDMYKLFGVKQDKSGGVIYYAYITAMDGYDSHAVLKLQNPSTDTTNNNKNYPRYWVDENGFRAGLTSYPTLSRFLAGRTYKWIAIWK